MDNLRVGNLESLDIAQRTTDASAATKFSGRTILILIGVAVILKVGQEILVPLALALLLTFALAPIVSFLRKRSVPKIVAVIFAVVSAFSAIALFSFLVATQVSNLAENIPTYQRNIVDKVQSLRAAGSGNGVIEHLSRVAERVGSELQIRAEESQEAEAVPPAVDRDPLPVEIITRSNPIQTLGNLILPLISPFATAGLVVVLVIFMLLEREDLRDRFIRLVGLGDLHRTTSALQDAGRRVGRYLLMQLVVNTLYAVPITLGLWILGIPNALLWGLLTLVLRFVPYIGPVIGMVLPLFLALAIAPGWSLVLWVAALFATVELISNNVIEPWLYGAHTGLSPLAIIVSAIFWSWLWGPLGLMLSTPLTVCLVVLGRHVPQFAFLDVLLGNEAVLEPHEKLYQRLLAGDPSEATDNAEEYLEEEYLADYYEKVGLPALLLAEVDRQRGVMSDVQLHQFASNCRALVENLSDIAEEEENEDIQPPDALEKQDPAHAEELPDGEGRTVLCLGGRGAMDDAAAAMLAQVLEVQGATVYSGTHADLTARPAVQPRIEGVETVIIAFLNGNSKSHARLMVRRVKRLRADVRVGIMIPLANGTDHPRIEAAEIGADFVCQSMSQTVIDALTVAPPVSLQVPVRRAARPRARLVKAVV
ncbi:AI-2E family transporter [Rhizobium sp. AG855]|uniref:AI-2E family transporter n=1 Tax=Rhizobium sp. AG855 TaxID=2183898 RepID=UPI000E73C41C|nr:AI-2E family transporter [Rhizobium sp. AG855]RKE83627.1 putative PurR-regulated permease PerM [Rhizobium sp. AG855]